MLLKIKTGTCKLRNKKKLRVAVLTIFFYIIIILQVLMVTKNVLWDKKSQLPLFIYFISQAFYLNIF